MKWLVDDWKKSWRFATVRFWVIIGVFAQLLEHIPALAVTWIDKRTATGLAILAIISIALRMYKQKSLSNDDPPNPPSDN